MKKILLLIQLFSGVAAFGQTSTDGASAYNKYMVVTENRTYIQVGRYKVFGNPYLLNGKHTGNIYANKEMGIGVQLSYNLYNQELEFWSADNQILIKEPGTVDSFLLRPDSLIVDDIFFVYGKVLGLKDKQYFQQLYKGSKFSLYKKYKAGIEVVSTNYVEADLRQFVISSEYYYYNEKAQEWKKIKANSFSLKKEFHFLKNIDAYANEDRLFAAPEKILKELFNELNSN